MPRLAGATSQSESTTLPGLHGREGYNATLSAILEIHSELRILRVVPDAGVPAFEAGQYVSLGLGLWEPRVASTDVELLDDVQRQRLAKRAYSISCSLLDEHGLLHRAPGFSYLEFYVALIRHGEQRPPALTPRLFALTPGARLFVSAHVAGHYTLSCIQPAEDIFFFATGTGEAPHNAMIADLLVRGHRGRIVNAVSVKLRRDAAYRTTHEELMRRFANYQYLLATTREPENTDPQRRGLVGKRYLQDLLRSGELERSTRVPLDPAHAHVFLCGNPAMIGAPRHHESTAAPAIPGSMLDLLLQRGFQIDEPKQPGNVHFERYW